jgi:hypothetical protein
MHEMLLGCSCLALYSPEGMHKSSVWNAVKLPYSCVFSMKLN